MRWEELGIVRTLETSAGGRVLGPLGFAVREIALPHHVCPEPFGGNGQFYLGALAKVGLSTLDALDEAERSLGKGYNLRYSGLKDANAVSCQYISADAPIRAMRRNGWALMPLGRTSVPLDHAFLYGNRFFVQVLGAQRPELLISPEVGLHQRKFPNFFGPQRFGLVPPFTHQMGRMILQGEEPEELRRAAPRLRAKLTELAVQAYQSYLFNLFLKRRILSLREPLSPHPGDLVAPLNVFGLPNYSLIHRVEEVVKRGEVLLIPVPGEGVKGNEIYDELLREEGELPPKGVKGWYREASFSPLSYGAQLHKDRAYLSFELKKSQYASVLLHELLGGEEPIPLRARASSCPAGTALPPSRLRHP